jgi:integrase
MGNRYQEWCAKASIDKTTQITRGKLGAYRDWIVSAPRLAPRAGGKRGERARTAKHRTPRSINRTLPETHTMLTHWLDRDLLRLSAHELKRALRPIPSAEHRIVFYNRKQLARLPLDEPFVRFVLLSGVRLGEALGLTWTQVTEGEIHISAESKTRKARTVDMTIYPSVTYPKRGNAPDSERVWRDWTPGVAAVYAKRHKFGWQALRWTCSTYLTCSAICGAATPWHAAKRAGHSLAVAEGKYAGLVKVDPEARALEQAMTVL